MRKLEKIYWIFVMIYGVLLLQALFSFGPEIKSKEGKEGFVTISDYSVETLKDANAPLGIRQRYTFTADEGDTPCYLVFFTVHQEIMVTMDGERVYSMQSDYRNSFGRTPGCVCNTIRLTQEAAGKEISIDFLPVYQSSVDAFPTLYLGDRYEIMSTVILRDLPSVLLSLIAIVAGIFYIGFVLYAHKHGTANSNLIMLGTFSILIGLWKLADMEIFSVFVNNNLISAYIPFFSLALACVPYGLFVRNIHTNRTHKIWDVSLVVCYVNMFLGIVLHLLKIADFRETLLLTHISICLMMVVIVTMMILEIRKHGFHKQLKRNVLCISGCIVGFAIDMMIYYNTNAQGALLCGMLGFVTYIVVLGVDSMQEIRKLIAIGQEARKYEQMAFHDKLTGLFNRTAYADFIGKEDFTPEYMIVAMFDLNNLKKCNDELGHDKGDIYIMSCARLISGQFADIGNCYRIGGDEFCVLMKGISLAECKNRVEALYQEVRTENEKQQLGINMAVACGYVMYDKRIDYDIQDTVRRADKMMYKEKYSMKHPDSENQTE